MRRSQRATSEVVRPTPPPAGAHAAVRQQHSAPDDDRHRDQYEVHRIGGAAAAIHDDTNVQQVPLSSSSVASNMSVSSYESCERQRQQRAISHAFFGPSSQATDIYFDTDQENVDADASFRDYYSHTSDDDGDDDDDYDGGDVRGSTLLSKKRNSSRATSDASSIRQLLLSEDSDRVLSAEEAAVKRRRRKENQEKFKHIARLADAHRPVSMSTFTRKSTRELTRPLGSKRSFSEKDRKLNTELFEAYLAYSRSIGHEPQIEIHAVDEEESNPGTEDLEERRAPFANPRRPVVKEHTHPWTDMLGTRHSKRRGCLQFWAWLSIGVVVSIIMAFFLASLSLNEVLHLDAFVKDNVVVTNDYTYLYLRDEVTFGLTYDIQSTFTPTDAQPTPGNESYFQVMLLYEDDFESYVEGEPFNYIPEGSTLRTTYASLPLTTIENVEHEEVYFVVQPCVLPWNPGADYCQTRQLPTPINDGRKVYKLKKQLATTNTSTIGLAIRRLYVNPKPNTCSDSGWQGGWYLIIFLPYVVLALFGLRVFQMLYRCESFRANLERKYKSEFEVPENEVDYWQPMPWDRKVPKTRLLGPCCWKKMRKPFEPFYTWWRHENYFTWIFCPYRNERLSRGERAIIVFCSLYLTFYVLFVLVMLRDAIGSSMSVFASVLIYYVLIMILPSLGKAIFKEIFKLIFRQRRKYFRVKAMGGDTEGFSFRFAFFLQVLVAVLISFTQLPMFYIWLYRSCEFLKQFMYFGILAAFTRLSILGLVQDYIWYLVIKTWGWRDLCPYCTERLVHCDCFNDELLVISVERVGSKWELIMVLDALLGKQEGYSPQFDQYTPEQLRERWQILVDRAEAHMEKVEKLIAYREKKRMDQMRRERVRESFMNATSFLSFRGDANNNAAAASAAVDAALDDQQGGGAKHKNRKHHHHHHHHDSNTEEEDAGSTPGSSEDLELIGGCSLREKKILALNSKIKLDKFEKHYDSTIVDVFHSIQSTLTRRRRHHADRDQRREERRERRALRREQQGLSADMDRASFVSDVSDIEDGDERTPDGDTTAPMTSSGGSGSSSSGSIGETMWVYDSPRQRLERRELEKQRRKKAFRVLDNYFIETVEPERDERGEVHYVPSSTPSAVTTADQAAPVDDTTAGAPVPPPPSSHKTLKRKDSKFVQLLKRQKSMAPRDEDVVVVVSDSVDTKIHITEVDEEDDDEEEKDAYPSEHEDRASVGSSGTVPPPPQSRTYAVMERKPSLLRKASSSANSFASWIFKIDKDSAV